MAKKLKRDKRVVFTVDLEDWNHGLHCDKRGHTSGKAVAYLEGLLARKNIKAIFYVLGDYDREVIGMTDGLRDEGHAVMSHGEHHTRNEPTADRKPYSWLGFTGGFYFRLFPYKLIKWFVERKGMFYIHPHDLDEDHPKLKNPIMNWKRRVGLKTARMKLERLTNDIKWKTP